MGGAEMAHCYPACSGAMVNENALKVCMQARNGAPRVLAFSDNFIGRTVTLSHIGDSPGHRQGVPKSIEVDYLPYWDAADPSGSSCDALDALNTALAAHPGEHACLVMELVQGEGGFTTAPRDFFEPLLVAARDASVPIWFDEIQTFGRTDHMFRFEGLDLGSFADIITVGKMTQAAQPCGELSSIPSPACSVARSSDQLPRWRAVPESLNVSRQEMRMVRTVGMHNSFGNSKHAAPSLQSLLHIASQSSKVAAARSPPGVEPAG